MTRRKRRTVGQRSIDAWFRERQKLLRPSDTPATHASLTRGFIAGYLAGWRAAKREKREKP